MVAHHQILMHQIIYSFETDTTDYQNWLLNLPKLLLLKWLIYGNHYLTFYNNRAQKGSLRAFKCLQKTRKKCYFYWFGYLYYLLNKQKILQCFIIKNIFSNSTEHAFFRNSHTKSYTYYHRNILQASKWKWFFKCFQTSSSNLTAKPIKFIFSKTLISTYFKMENLSSKKISHVNLKVPALP